MDSSNITATTTNTTTSNYNLYQEIPLISSFLNLPQPPPPPPPPPPSSSPSPSFFDPLPSYLIPNFHQEPSSSSSSQPPPPPPSPPPPRSNKKRSRASRRAPTTVLTTDTSNFRAMVQEFTGFPAPPFSASSSSLPRPPRFDHLSSSPYFLPRPFPHKPPTPSSFVDAIAAATAANAAAYPFANAATSMIGIQNQTPHPQFGNHLITSFAAAANSEGMQQPQQHVRPSWADHDPQDPHDQLQQQEKRRKTSGADGGVVESWIHSSD